VQTTPFRWCALVSTPLVLFSLVGCDRPDSVMGSASQPTFAVDPGASSPTGSLAAGRSAHVAVRLGDGRVLVAGGVNGFTRLASAELFSPGTGTWSTTASMSAPRLGHAAVLLADGRVLVVGGASFNGCAAAPVGTGAEIYDPATGKWTVTGSMKVARNSSAIVLLASGKVLVAGGGDRCGRLWNSAELYDPATGAWTLTGFMVAPRQSAAAVRLSDGRVLVAGGMGVYPFPSVATAELYDPASGTWKATGSMNDPRMWTLEDMSALGFLALLPDGRVFTAGGLNRCNAFDCPSTVSLNSADLYDPASGTWTRTGAMAGRRSEHQMTVLPSGYVLVTGGRNGGSVLKTVELFDAASGKFLNAATLVTGRFDHTTTPLADGRALIAGGLNSTGLSAAEVYVLNRSPVANAGSGVSGTEGSPVSFDGSTSSDPDGDALTYSWDFGDHSPAATGATQTHTYADNGTYSVTLTVSDGKASSTATTTATIANVPPTVYAFAGGSILPGETFASSGWFGDPGADSWTGTVDYGDGSGAQPLTLTGKEFALSHSYRVAGSYTVTVTVTDDDGGSGAGHATIVVETAQQAIEGLLMPRVEALASSGALDRGNANALCAILRAAEQQLARDGTTPAANQLAAFRHQVDALVRSERLSPSDAQGLLDALERILAAVEPGGAQAASQTRSAPGSPNRSIGSPLIKR